MTASILLFLSLLVNVNAVLYSWGNNVCSKYCTEDYTKKIATSAACGFQGWSTCSAYRSASFSKTVTCYICCDGWSTDEASGHCNIASCFGLSPKGKCRNNGICLSPNLCECPSGTELPECEDIDECASNNGDCGEICQNTIGSYECKCYAGNALVDDKQCAPICFGQSPGVCQNGGTCVGIDKCDCAPGTSPPICDDINECQGSHGCEQQCINKLGSYVCNCQNGYGLIENKRNCLPICFGETVGKCSYGNRCTAPDTCECQEGFLSPQCKDVNECDDPAQNNCEQVCVNVPGSFKCECEAGYILSPDTGVCEDLDECAEENGGCSDRCINTIASFRCVCPTRYSVGIDKKTCQDTNECATNNGACYLSCTNLEGSFLCECGHGYKWDNNSLSCKPVCFGGNPGECHNGGTCRNPGVCACLSGFLPPRCTDLDECNSAGVCDQQCENTLGSYICSCLPGYNEGAGGACLDVDECITGDNVCVQGCTNTDGSYTCECPAQQGWHSPSLTCKPVCFGEAAGSCANGGECISPDKCVCEKGFQEPQCSDIDECAVNHGGCDPEACINSFGSYSCECSSGYAWVALTEQCAPVCNLLEPGTCPLGGVCIAPDVCQCAKGYGGNMCSDVDECSEGLASCNYYRCHNTMGSYYCDCEKDLGWNEKKQHCLPECSFGDPGDCPNGGTCYKPGQCTCLQGYELPSCSDVDECSGEHGCEHGCINTPGSYYCASNKTGYGRIPGDSQDKAICYGLLPGLCPNEGTCVTPDVCNCPVGFVAPQCDAADNCVGKDVECEGHCASAGDKYYCQSETGYGIIPGETKNTPVCFGRFPGECPNGGECSSPDMCGCREGYYPPQCHDENECLSDNGGCDKQCVNIPGSYYCQCWEGYGINPDDHECKPICFDSRPGTCNGGGVCVAINTCICEDGFEGERCADVNECVTGKTVCELECHNAPGTYTCDCQQGFGWDPQLTRCRPVCDHGAPGVCPNAGTCVKPNTCKCAEGFHSNKCEDIDECANNNGGCDNSCFNLPGKYYCSGSQAGYGRIPGETVDKPICSGGHLPGTCVNGGQCTAPEICMCPSGYQLPGCTDIDECLTGEVKCLKGCQNVDGSYYCLGEDGYGKAPGDTMYKPVCGVSLPGKCANNGRCVKPGVCSCAEGFLMPDCTEVDNTCDRCGSTLCVNLVGPEGCRCSDNFQSNTRGVCSNRLPCSCGIETDCLSSNLCGCAEGFEGSDCKDRDECESGPCEIGCVNIPGSYYCEAETPGYGIRPGENQTRPVCFGEMPGSCANGGDCLEPGVCTCNGGYQTPDCLIDIDECTSGSNGCQIGSCHNEIGTYMCDCPQDYLWDYTDKTCKASCFGEKPGMCANEGTCIRPWVCDCKSGFNLPDCSDINECSVNRGGCDGICHNTIGRYYCDCPDEHGWNHEKGMCGPICLDLSPGECPNGGECILPGVCRCPEGFATTECSDIDECSAQPSPCPEICKNIPGAYYCTDGSGFGFLNGEGTQIALCYTLPPGMCPNDGTCIEPEKCQCLHGFIPPGCSDKDECIINNGGCELACHNTNGFYYCDCGRGHGWSKEEKKCKSVCFGLPPGTCPNGGECLSGQICLCQQGFKTPDCSDIDECSTGEHVCELRCSNLHGSYSCDCAQGYIWKKTEMKCLPVCYGLVGSCLNEGSCDQPGVCSCQEGFSQPRCSDIDECAVNNGGCDRACTNLRGSYQCSCITGYNYDETDKECKALCGNSPLGTCPNDGMCIAPNKCRCKQGYEASSFCADINECSQDNICMNGSCVNTLGSYYCECEENGYGQGPTDTQCKAICFSGWPGVCPNGGNCTLPDKCSCAQGYGWPQCEDINECDSSSLCDYDCINEDGGYRCQCLQGHEWDEQDKSCKPMCFGEPPGKCPNGGECLNPGECQCLEGYEANSCDDIDECGRDETLCELGCINIPGSYYCLSDKPGYGQNPGETFIKPICNGLKPGVCSHGGICFSPDTCSCPRGFQHVGLDCEDIDECSSANYGGCTGHCSNMIGTYKCDCQLGYGWEEQMNRCLAVCDGLPPGKCPYGGTCVAPGNCECSKGFKQPDCSDIDECSQPEGDVCENGCINQNGFFYCAGSKPGYARIPGEDIDRPVCVESEYPGSCLNSGDCVLPDSCTCQPGFEQPYCDDIDECPSQSDIESCLQCINTPGSYFCDCEPGYSWSMKQQACTAVCFELPPGECPNGGSCVEPYVCSCLSGFTGNNCDDIDECVVENGGCSQTCENQIGSFSCLCSSGYTLTLDLRTCADSNECEVNNGDCPQRCVNLDGTYNCACGDGYLLSQTGVDCLDIDECGIRNGGCAEACVNSVGSFSCECSGNRGLGPDGKSCAAICYHYDAGTCGGGGICTDTDNCLCSSGYSMPYCIDVDECESDDHGCSDKCKNTDGSFVCTCNMGYRLDEDERTCTDMDECSLDDLPCSHKCVNLEGSYLCFCPKGYLLDDDRHTCYGEDQCKTDNGGCPFKCENTQDGPQCVCYEGYQSTGLVLCVDVDECTNGKAECSSVCFNTQGSWRCACEPGFRLMADGKSCEKCSGKSITDCLPVCTTSDDLECSCPDGYYPHSDGKHCMGGCPCQNNGFCESELPLYKCDCSETGYKGDLCTIPTVDTPAQISLRYPNGYVMIPVIVRPKIALIIKAHADPRLHITTNPIAIKTPESRGYFNVSANTTGIFKFEYSISGVDQHRFDKPPGTTIISGNIFERHQLHHKVLPVGCFKLALKYEITKTASGKLRWKPLLYNLEFMSTSPWYRLHNRTDVFFTFGIAHSTGNGDIELPLHDSGIEIVTRADMFQFGPLSPYREAKYGIKVGIMTKPTCKVIELLPTDSALFRSHQSLFKSLFRSVRYLMPSTLTLDIIEGDWGPVESYSVQMLTGYQVKAIHACKTARLVDDTLYQVALFGQGLKLQLFSQTIELQLSSKSSERFCLIITTPENDDKALHFVFPDSATTQLQEISALKMLNEIIGGHVLLKGFSMSPNGHSSVEEQKTSLWNGQGEFQHKFVNRMPPMPLSLYLEMEKVANRRDDSLEFSTSVEILFSESDIAKVFVPMFIKDSIMMMDFSTLKMTLTLNTMSSVDKIKLSREGVQGEGFMSVGVERTREMCGKEDDRGGFFLKIKAVGKLLSSHPHVGNLTFLPHLSDLYVTFHKLDSQNYEKENEVIKLLGQIRNQTKELSVFIDRVEEKTPPLELEVIRLKLADVAVSIQKRLNQNVSSIVLDSQVAVSISLALSDIRIRVENLDEKLDLTFEEFFNEKMINIADSLIELSESLTALTEAINNAVIPSIRQAHSWGLKSQVTLDLLWVSMAIEGEFHSITSGESCVCSSDNSFSLTSCLLGTITHVNMSSIIGPQYEKLSEFIQFYPDTKIKAYFGNKINQFKINAKVTITAYGIFPNSELVLNSSHVTLNTAGKLWGEFPVEIESAISIRAAKNPSAIRVNGMFSSFEDSSFVSMFEKSLQIYAEKVGISAMERVQSAEEHFLETEENLVQLNKDINIQTSKRKSSEEKYKKAVEDLKSAQRGLDSATDKLGDELPKINAICLDMACKPTCLKGSVLDLCTSKNNGTQITPCLTVDKCAIQRPHFECLRGLIGCHQARILAYNNSDHSSLLPLVEDYNQAVLQNKLSVHKSQLLKDELERSTVLLDFTKLLVKDMEQNVKKDQIVLDNVQKQLQASLYLHNISSKYGPSMLFLIRNCSFVADLETEYSRNLKIACYMNPINMGWRLIQVTINFDNSHSHLYKTSRMLIQYVLAAIRSEDARVEDTASNEKVKERLNNVPFIISENIESWNEECIKAEILEDVFSAGINLLQNKTVAALETISSIKDMSVDITQRLSVSSQESGIDVAVLENNYQITKKELSAFLSKVDPLENTYLMELYKEFSNSLTRNTNDMFYRINQSLIKTWEQEMNLYIKDDHDFRSCFQIQDCFSWVLAQGDLSTYSLQTRWLKEEKTKLNAIKNLLLNLLKNDSVLTNLDYTVSKMANTILSSKLKTNFCQTTQHVFRSAKDFAVQVGDAVYMQCLTNAKHETMVWRKTGFQNWKREANFLNFTSAYFSIEGKYHCTVLGSLFNISSLYSTVSVNSPAQTASVSKTKITCVEGDMVMLDCWASGVPVPSYWWVTNAIDQVKLTTRVLDFQSVSARSRGLYMCKTSNMHGRDSSKEVFLDVREAIPPCPHLTLWMGFLVSRLSKPAKSNGVYRDIRTNLLSAMNTILAEELANSTDMTGFIVYEDIFEMQILLKPLVCELAPPGSSAECQQWYSNQLVSLETNAERLRRSIQTSLSLYTSGYYGYFLNSAYFTILDRLALCPSGYVKRSQYVCVREEQTYAIGPPHNLTFREEDKGAVLEWLPPDKADGFVRAYNVTVKIQRTGEVYTTLMTAISYHHFRISLPSGNIEIKVRAHTQDHVGQWGHLTVSKPTFADLQANISPIIGAVIGSVVGIAIIGVVMYFTLQKYNFFQRYRRVHPSPTSSLTDLIGPRSEMDATVSSEALNSSPNVPDCDGNMTDAGIPQNQSNWATQKNYHARRIYMAS